MGDTDQKTTRSEIVFVIVLFAVMGVVIAGVVLQERGIWPSPETMPPIYQVLWAVMWLPGMVVLGLVFRRERRASLGIGMALQMAAVVLFATRVEWLGLAAGAGLGGVALPLILATVRERAPLKHRLPRLAWCVALAILIPSGAALCGRGTEDLSLYALCLFALLVPYVGMLWPELLQSAAESDRREKEWWSRHPWLNRGLKAAGVALVLWLVWVAVQTVLLYRSLTP